MNICIFGASSNRPEGVYFDESKRLGALIARAGHCLVFGGGADGLMGACARGTLEAGGNAVGIAPRLFDEPGFLLRDCTELILTDTMSDRKEKMLAMSEAYIALPGGIGTMDEFFEAITLKQLGHLKGPLVLLNTNEFYCYLLCFLEEMAEKGFMSRNCLALLRVCATPEEALRAAETPDKLVGSVRRLEDYTGS